MRSDFDETGGDFAREPFIHFNSLRDLRLTGLKGFIGQLGHGPAAIPINLKTKRPRSVATMLVTSVSPLPTYTAERLSSALAPFSTTSLGAILLRHY